MRSATLVFSNIAMQFDAGYRANIKVQQPKDNVVLNGDEIVLNGDDLILTDQSGA
jgi:hypothetical protein